MPGRKRAFINVPSSGALGNLRDLRLVAKGKAGLKGESGIANLQTKLDDLRKLRSELDKIPAHERLLFTRQKAGIRGRPGTKQGSRLRGLEFGRKKGMMVGTLRKVIDKRLPGLIRGINKLAGLAKLTGKIASSPVATEVLPMAFDIAEAQRRVRERTLNEQDIRNLGCV